MVLSPFLCKQRDVTGRTLLPFAEADVLRAGDSWGWWDVRLRRVVAPLRECGNDAGARQQAGRFRGVLRRWFHWDQHMPQDQTTDAPEHDSKLVKFNPVSRLPKPAPKFPFALPESPVLAGVRPGAQYPAQDERATVYRKCEIALMVSMPLDRQEV